MSGRYISIGLYSGVAVKRDSTVYTCSYSLGLTCCKELTTVPRCPALRLHFIEVVCPSKVCMEGGLYCENTLNTHLHRMELLRCTGHVRKARKK